MQDTLDALRKSEDQQALFQPEIPIEEALKALLRRDGGRRGHRALDVLDRAEPLDLAERNMNYNELVVGNEAREQNRHRWAVFAARGVDRD